MSVDLCGSAGGGSVVASVELYGSAGGDSMVVSVELCGSAGGDSMVVSVELCGSVGGGSVTCIPLFMVCYLSHRLICVFPLSTQVRAEPCSGVGGRYALVPLLRHPARCRHTHQEAARPLHGATCLETARRHAANCR